MKASATPLDQALFMNDIETKMQATTRTSTPTAQEMVYWLDMACFRI